jgi:hypothetical protein
LDEVAQFSDETCALSRYTQSSAIRLIASPNCDFEGKEITGAVALA